MSHFKRIRAKSIGDFFSPISIIHRLVRDGRDEKKIPSVRSGVELEEMGDDKKNVVKKKHERKTKMKE